MKNKTGSVIIGGYVNGYNIIRELHDSNVSNIILVDYTKSIASYSNKIKEFFLIKKSSLELLQVIQKLHREYTYIVLYPTDDYTLELLMEIYDDISEFCFIPFNKKTIEKSLYKSYQYQICKEIGIPTPQTTVLASSSDISLISNINFPVIIKPSQRKDISNADVFRSKQYTTLEEIYGDKALVLLLNNGHEFIASEIIPGNGSQIYAYTAYRSKQGIILSEWLGKKLSQYPNDFGVFSSATNDAPEIIQAYGRKLLEALDVHGIAEPEFKYDSRDDTYKLMEVNLRSMMWHRLGNRTGIRLQLTQYHDALKQSTLPMIQDMETTLHFVYMKHELINLCTRSGYFKTFYRNICTADSVTWAVFDTSDILPGVIDSLRTIVILIKVICKRILSR